MQRHVIQDAVEFERVATQWDDLWSKSEVTSPLIQARAVLNWHSQFGKTADLCVPTVWRGETLVAAVPIAPTRKLRVFRAGEMTSNCWSNSGDVLFDRSIDRSVLARQLVECVKETKAGFVCFDEVPIETRRWKGFTKAMKDVGLATRIAPSHWTPVTDATDDFDAYIASCSGNHRRAVKKAIRRLNELGKVVAQCHTTFDEPNRLRTVLEECFEVENRSWKGKQGSSINRCGLADFYVKLAEILELAGALQLWTLRLDDQLIAFEFCFSGKGTVFSDKISFDREYAKFSPGNVLRYFQHERYHRLESCRLFDMLGADCQNKSKWATGGYLTGRITVGVSPLAKAIVAAANLIRPTQSHDDKSRETLSISPEPVTPSEKNKNRIGGTRDEKLSGRRSKGRST